MSAFRKQFLPFHLPMQLQALAGLHEETWPWLHPPYPPPHTQAAGTPNISYKYINIFFKRQGPCRQILHVVLQVVEGAEEQCGVLRRGTEVGGGGKSPFIHI